MSDKPQPPNVFFRLVIVASAVFIITIFAMVAVMFGDPRAPLAQLLNEYSGKLLVVEVAAILITGWLGMTIDHHRSRQHRPSDVEPDQAETNSRSPNFDPTHGK